MTDPVRRPTEGERFIAAHGPAKVHFSLFVGAFLLAVLLVYSGQLAGSSDWRTWLGFAFSLLWAVLMGLAVGRLAAYFVLHPLYWTASRDNGPFFKGARVLILHGPHRNKPGTVVGAVGQHEGQWAVRVLEAGEEGPEVELPGFQLLRTNWVPDKTPLFKRRPPARPRAP